MMQTIQTVRPHAAMNDSHGVAGMHCAESSSSNSSAVSSSSSSSRSRHSHQHTNSDAISTSSAERTNNINNNNPGIAPTIMPNAATSASSSSSSSTNVRSSNSSTTSSSSNAAAVAARRIRTIRLTRPNSSATARRSVLISTAQSTAFGFAIRGGREFAIGFFVSRIEKGSEADAKGLRVGDQLIRVNGYAVDDAVHRELSQYVSGQDRLMLKVRGVGILPSKERTSDALTWMVVPNRVPTAGGVHHMHKGEEFTCQDVKITLDVEPRTKLGLGICKGPEWKPGIFVQFTKDLGVARDAGLRPGDQLLSCNGVDFGDVLFSEAVAVMKASQRLELIVRNAAGVDLFPGESSGYNSSASSVTGDQSPCWGDQASKRLSIVREEDGSDKFGLNRALNWDRQNELDRRKERRLHHVDPPIVPEFFRPPPTPSDANNKTNTTIIKLSETGTIINNTMVPLVHRSQPPNKCHQNHRQSTEITVEDHHQTNNHGEHSRNNIRVNITNSSNNDPNQRPAAPHQQTQRNQHNSSANCDPSTDSKVADICFVSRKIETKTVTVEVHRGPTTPGDAADIPPPPPPMMMASMTPPCTSLTASSNGRHSSLSSSSMSVPGSCDAVSLSSAISEELKKRKERGRYEVNPESNATASDEKPANNRIVLKKVRSAFGGDDGDKHTALIDEFKLAHKKMFRHQQSVDEASNVPNAGDDRPLAERQEELRESTAKHSPPDYGVHKCPPKTLPPPTQRFDAAARKNPATPSPDYDQSAAPSPVNGSSTANAGNGTAHHHPIPSNGGGYTAAAPNSRKGTMGRCAAHEIAKANGDSAELASIDSYKMTNPASPEPKPPSMYFNSQSTGPATLKKPLRSVSVTIGEYAGRKEMPKQFDFIGRGEVDGTAAAGLDGTEVDVNGRLKNELESTLSRSNLRARNDTESRKDQQTPLKSTNRSISNGAANPIIYPPPNLFKDTNGSGRPLHKTQSNVEKITAMLVSQNLMGSRPTNGHANNPSPVATNQPITTTTTSSNRVTININQTSGASSAVPAHHRPNGILKNGTSVSASSNGHSSHSSTVTTPNSEPKNISFGNITTVLTDNV